jgi:hypothetical protein
MWDYRAALVRLVDGDSLVALIDQGMGGRQEEELRLLDVHAPEKHQPGGLETLTFVAAWVQQLKPLRWPLHIYTVPNTSPEPAERRTFVRYLATVYDFADQSRCLNLDVQAFLAQHPEWGLGL